MYLQHFNSTRTSSIKLLLIYTTKNSKPLSNFSLLTLVPTLLSYRYPTMASPNMQGDALRVFEVLKSGGTAICPADVGYAIMTCNPRALEKVFNTKKRGSHKRHAMIGSYAIHRSLHTMSPEHAEIVTSLTQDFDLPLGVIGKYKPEHELIKGLDDLTMEASSVGGTISVLVNAGKFQDELTKLTAEAALPLLGSSANLSGTGLLIDRH
jgi:hypothetical protein